MGGIERPHAPEVNTRAARPVRSGSTSAYSASSAFVHHPPCRWRRTSTTAWQSSVRRGTYTPKPAPVIDGGDPGHEPGDLRALAVHAEVEGAEEQRGHAARVRQQSRRLGERRCAGRPGWRDTLRPVSTRYATEGASHALSDVREDQGILSLHTPGNPIRAMLVKQSIAAWARTGSVKTS